MENRKVRKHEESDGCHSHRCVQRVLRDSRSILSKCKRGENPCRSTPTIGHTYSYGCCDLCAHATGDRSFVTDEKSTCFAHGLTYGIDIPRDDRSQVDHFARDVLLRCHLSDLAKNVNLCAPRNHRYVSAFLKDFSFRQWNRVFFQRHVLFRRSVENLRFEEDARIVVLDAREK